MHNTNILSQMVRHTSLRIATYALVVIGIALNLLFIVPNGNNACIAGVCGIAIGEWHYHDALWHIAVARNAFTSFPLTFPSASGFPLVSYNYLLGFILFMFDKLGVSPLIVYFKILPIAGNVALFLVLLRYFRITKKSIRERFFITFFTYLGSSFSYLLILYKNSYSEYSILTGFPVVATLQPTFVLSNIQFFLAVSIFLYIFTDIVIHMNNIRVTLLHCVLLALCVGLKIYTGIALFMLLIVGGVYNAIKRKSLKPYVFNFILYGVVFVGSTFLFYMPLHTYSKSFPFGLSPFAIPHAITESHDLFYDKGITLARYYLYGIGKLSPRLIALEITSAVLFIAWNLGTRIVAFWVLFVWVMQKQKITFEKFVLFSGGLIGLFFPIFFVQTGDGWYNSIQFAYLSIYLFGILAGLTLAEWIKKPSFFMYCLVAVICALTIPNDLLTLKLVSKQKLVIPQKELTALHFLRQQPNGVTLSFPDEKNSSYVPAFAEKVGYMIDHGQAQLLSLPVAERIIKVNSRDCSILNDITYLYLNSPTGVEFVRCSGFSKQFKRIYKDNSIVIFQKKNTS